MLVGVPKEIKDNEFRVGLVPSTVRELTHNGHRVMVEQGAGLGAGIADADYQAAGAEIAPDADAVFGKAVFQAITDRFDGIQAGPAAAHVANSLRGSLDP